MTVLQAVLIALYYVLAESPWPFGSMGTWATIDRPLVSGFFVGLILGDPVKGCIIGATINIMYLGVISAGGTLPEDSSMAGIMGTAFAIAGGFDTNAALALAVPLGVIGSVIWVLTMTAQCFVVQLAQKWIDEGKSGLMMLANVWLPQSIKAIIRFILAYVIVYFGSKGVVAAADAMNGSAVLQALNVMGGVLPAVGIGVMLTTIFKGKARLFLFLGFFAASFLGLNTIAIALIFFAFPFWLSGLQKTISPLFTMPKMRRKPRINCWIKNCLPECGCAGRCIANPATTMKSCRGSVSATRWFLFLRGSMAMIKKNASRACSVSPCFSIPIIISAA